MSVKINDGSANYEMEGSLQFTKKLLFDGVETGDVDEVHIWHNHPSGNLAISNTEKRAGEFSNFLATCLIGKEDIPELVRYLKAKYPEAF